MPKVRRRDTRRGHTTRNRHYPGEPRRREAERREDMRKTVSMVTEGEREGGGEKMHEARVTGKTMSGEGSEQSGGREGLVGFLFLVCFGNLYAEVWHPAAIPNREGCIRLGCKKEKEALRRHEQLSELHQHNLKLRAVNEGTKSRGKKEDHESAEGVAVSSSDDEDLKKEIRCEVSTTFVA